MHLSCTDTNTFFEQKGDSSWPTSSRSSIRCMQNDFQAYGTFDANCAPILHQDLHYFQMDWAFTWALSPRSTIGCIQNDFWADVTFGANCAPILHRHYCYLRKERSEIPHDPHHLGVPLGVPKTMSEPMVRSTQTVHLSCTDTNTISKRKEVRFLMTRVT
jgi:hypothetical protein